MGVDELRACQLQHASDEIKIQMLNFVGSQSNFKVDINLSDGQSGSNKPVPFRTLKQIHFHFFGFDQLMQRSRVIDGKFHFRLGSPL